MTFSAMLALGWLGLAPAQPELAPPPPAPTPAAAAASLAPRPVAVPEPSSSANDAVPSPAPAESANPAKESKAPIFTFTLGGKCENITPSTHGDAKGDGKVDVEAGDNQVKAVLGAAAGANVFIGVESTATETVHLVQEFEISCSDTSISQVYLTLESNLLGFLRSKHKASAGVRLASATIAPVGWPTTPLAVSYPTVGVGGPNGCNGGPKGYKYETPLEPVKAPPMPLGRYVLHATFVVSASASGLLDAHSTAIFMTESEDLDAWEREHDPFKGDSHDDFGFTLTLKADAPPGFPAVTHRKSPKRISSQPRARQAH
ncbi:hypothetical protein SAMN05444166_2050 [Singulisphaera sp. GP187]|uniref:hypothetical protein n=1 Tax=Singulisphaera sp. GP187 TaxID=1882752 RepID=UPI0009265A11|nr:hypothetical protein [Singulisphaera sp. GP187]SIO01646.1 hypothetical protein SAMN05444166_2050 [Singulisphaera sp. GP187]